LIITAVLDKTAGVGPVGRYMKHSFFSQTSYLRYAISILVFLVFFSCRTQEKISFKCGPVFSQKKVERIFQPIVSYLDIQPGDVFADVGASSGYYDVMMASLLDSVTFYIQDIDTDCLNEQEFTTILNYYSLQKGKRIDNSNKFHLVIGEVDRTNLPDDTFDIIYSNATYHLLDSPDKLIRDIHGKLKSDGYLYVRDNFSTDEKERICPDEGCKIPFANYDDFLKILEDNGFHLVEVSPKFGKYPIHKFAKK
jgi:SAM-dependent methyltransferase